MFDYDCTETAKLNTTVSYSEYSVAEVARHEELNLQDCAKRVHNARLLRAYIEKLMRQLYDDCRNQKNATDQAFVMNIMEMKDLKKKIEERHKEVKYSNYNF